MEVPLCKANECLILIFLYFINAQLPFIVVFS